MTSSLVRLASEGAAHNTLPMAPWVYAAIALTLFLLGLAVLWSFRGTAARIRGAGHPDAGGHH